MADDEALWDAERLRNVGSVLARYGAHIAPGHRVRLGMEGDPCAVYRAAADAPCATVLDVQRDPASGFVRFRAQLDGSPAVVELDNRSVSPEKLWEIAPDYLDTFRAHVDAASAEPDAPEPDAPDAPDAPEPAPEPDALDAYRSAVDDELGRFRGQLDELREDLRSAVRELSGDVMRAARGEQTEFAQRYVDRHDLAVAEAAADGFRAAEEDARRARLQREKTHFGEEDYPDSVAPLRFKAARAGDGDEDARDDAAAPPADFCEAPCTP